MKQTVLAVFAALALTSAFAAPTGPVPADPIVIGDPILEPDMYVCPPMDSGEDEAVPKDPCQPPKCESCK